MAIVSAATHFGDRPVDGSVEFLFTTMTTEGVPSALTSGVISVYKEDDLAQETAGVTLTASYDSVTGLNRCAIDLSADGFYEGEVDYSVVLTTGTVDSESVAGVVLGRFSIGTNYDPMDATVETGYDTREVLRLLSAVLCGKATVSGTTTTFRNITDTKDRVTATADDGARSAVTLVET